MQALQMKRMIIRAKHIYANIQAGVQPDFNEIDALQSTEPPICGGSERLSSMKRPNISRVEYRALSSDGATVNPRESVCNPPVSAGQLAALISVLALSLEHDAPHPPGASDACSSVQFLGGSFVRHSCIQRATAASFNATPTVVCTSAIGQFTWLAPLGTFGQLNADRI